MSSKSFINLCSALTLSRFLAEIVLKDCPAEDKGNRKIRRLCDRIVEHVHATRDLWPAVDASDLQQISDRLNHLGDKVLYGPRNMTELVAVALALLVDMEPHLRGARQAAIGKLIEMMESINREFDGRLEDQESYEYASKATDAWYAVVGM